MRASSGACSRLPLADIHGKVLVTWRSSTVRIDELLIPVIDALEPQHCAVLYDKKDVLPRVPRGAVALSCDDAVPHDRGVWLTEFRRCCPAWRTALKAACRRY